MYKSPIDIIYGQIETQLEGDVLRAVQKVGVDVDKHELLRALQYDRDQYEKGYADGKRDAINELVRCKDCKRSVEENGTLVCDHALPTKRLTEYIVIGTDIVAIVKPDDFCSYGERRYTP